MPPKKCSAKNGFSGKWVIVVAGLMLIVVGLTIGLREGWSSPSRSGGRVSGNPGVGDEWGPHSPPHSERQLLLPHPSYEHSAPQQQRQHFYVKNRLGDTGSEYTAQPDFSVPTFGGGFRKVGIIFNANHPDLKLPLYGRPTYPGGNRFEYYVMDDTPHANELPLDDHNGLELTTDDVVRVPGYDGDFTVYVYAYGAPF